MSKLQNKIAVITGGSTGIGSATFMRSHILVGTDFRFSKGIG